MLQIGESCITLSGSVRDLGVNIDYADHFPSRPSVTVSVHDGFIF